MRKDWWVKPFAVGETVFLKNSYWKIREFQGGGSGLVVLDPVEYRYQYLNAIVVHWRQLGKVIHVGL